MRSMVPMYFVGGVRANELQSYPVQSTPVLPAVAVKLCVPSISVAPTGMLLKMTCPSSESESGESTYGSCNWIGEFISDSLQRERRVLRASG